MSEPEFPAQTESQQILAKQDATNQRLDAHAAAINSIGENLQWLVDNVKSLFQMFQNPAFLGQLMSAMPNVQQEGNPDGG